MCSFRYILSCLIVASVAMLSACGGKKTDSQVDSDVLVTVGDSSLRLNDVIVKIPVGLNPADSAAMFHQIVDNWIRDLVLIEFAEKNVPDIDRIDRMTMEYRNNLIVNEYIQSMSETSTPKVSEKRIREYYNQHHADLILDQPLVKGAYLKVPLSDTNLPNLRKWMASFSEESIDNIEKSGLHHALQYNYFKDQWYEWSAIADQIPFRFDDADIFVKNNKNFETSDAASTYLLHIHDFIPSGSKMPYEFAKLKISQILHNSDVVNFRKQLVSDIYRDCMKNGSLKPGLYDPIKCEMKPSPTPPIVK